MIRAWRALSTARVEGPVATSIRKKLEETFAPSHLKVKCESYMHRVPEGTEKHFHVQIVSDKFEGGSVVQVTVDNFLMLRAWRAMSTATAEGPVATLIRKKLEETFSPSHLEILCESYMHNVPKGAEKHFLVQIVSEKFEGCPVIQVLVQMFGKPSPSCCSAERRLNEETSFKHSALIQEGKKAEVGFIRADKAKIPPEWRRDIFISPQDQLHSEPYHFPCV